MEIRVSKILTLLSVISDNEVRIYQTIWIRKQNFPIYVGWIICVNLQCWDKNKVPHKTLHSTSDITATRLQLIPHVNWIIMNSQSERLTDYSLFGKNGAYNQNVGFLRTLSLESNNYVICVSICQTRTRPGTSISFTLKFCIQYAVPPGDFFHLYTVGLTRDFRLARFSF